MEKQLELLDRKLRVVVLQSRMTLSEAHLPYFSSLVQLCQGDPIIHCSNKCTIENERGRNSHGYARTEVQANGMQLALSLVTMRN